MSKIVKVNQHKARSSGVQKTKHHAVRPSAELLTHKQAAPTQEPLVELPKATAKDTATEAIASPAQGLDLDTTSAQAATASTSPTPVSSHSVPASLELGASPTTSQGPSLAAWAQHISPDVFKPLLAFGGALALIHLAGDSNTEPASPTVAPPVVPPLVPGSSDGRAIDGYLSNALVWRDTNNNQTWDAGEPYSFTDANGAFSGLTHGAGSIRVTGITSALRAALANGSLALPTGPSTDISTGKVFEGVLSAPEGASVINPLTTLVVAVGTGPNAAATLASLKAALGIDASVDLANFDPLASMASGGNAAAALAIQAASIQVASLLTMAVATLQSGGSGLSVGTIVQSVATSLVSQVGNAGAGQLLTNPDLLKAALQTAAASSGVTDLTALNATLAEATKALAQVNSAIQTAVANAGKNLNLADALGALTSVVAAQLVADDLTALVKAAAAPGATTVFNAASVDSFRAGLSAQIEAAKSSVKQLVVTPPNQALLVAVDDSLVVDKTPYQWPVKTGNIASNDLVGGGALQITSLSQGEHNSSTSGGEQVLQGSYGVLRVDSNGNYSYTVNRDVPVNTDGTAHTEVFNYVAKNGSLTDTGKIVITLNNAVTHLALLSDMLTVLDAGHATAVQGTVQGSKISFNLAVHGAGLDAQNLRNLLDGNDETPGQSPELQFDLQNLTALNITQATQTIAVQLSVHSSWLSGFAVNASFDAPIQFVRGQDGAMHLALPSGTTVMHLSAAGVELGQVSISNLDSDSFTLVEGVNAAPSLSIKLDHLLAKATDNALQFGALNATDVLPLAAGVLAGAFANKTVGDIVKLAQDIVRNIDAVQDSKVNALIDRLKGMADMPDAFAGITLNEGLHLAAVLFNLPDMPNDLMALANRVVQALGDSTLPQALQFIQDAYPDTTLGHVLTALGKNISLSDGLRQMPVADLADNLVNLQTVASAFTLLLGADGATVSSLIEQIQALTDTQGVNLDALNQLFDISPLFGDGYTAADLVHDLSTGQIAADPVIAMVSKVLLSSDSTVTANLHLPEGLGLTSANGTALQDIEVLLKVGTDIHTATAVLRDVNDSLDLSDLQSLKTNDLSGLYISQPSAGQFTVNGKALTGLVDHLTQAQLSQLDFTPPPGQSKASLNTVDVTLWAEDAHHVLTAQQHVCLYLV
jgi:VCBS repeat-containing protein